MRKKLDWRAILFVSALVVGPISLFGMAYVMDLFDGGPDKRAAIAREETEERVLISELNDKRVQLGKNDLPEVRDALLRAKLAYLEYRVLQIPADSQYEDRQRGQKEALAAFAAAVADGEKAMAAANK